MHLPSNLKLIEFITMAKLHITHKNHTNYYYNSYELFTVFYLSLSLCTFLSCVIQNHVNLKSFQE